MSVPFDEVEAAEPTPSAQAGLPKSTMIVSALAIAAAVLMTFVLVQWSDARTKSAELSAEIAEIDGRLAELRPELAAAEGQLSGLEERTGLLAPGKLAVCNHSASTVTVKMVAATWLGEDGELRTFNSTDHGLDLWRVPAGERQVIERPQAGWDGSVTYYALWLRAQGQEFPFAGTWPPDEGNDCVEWR